MSGRCLVWLGALSMGAAASAQSTDEVRLKPQWQALDANRDGKVMLSELHPIQAASMKGAFRHAATVIGSVRTGS